MARIAIVLTNGFADWEYSLIAGTGAPFYGLEVRFFTVTPGLVTSQGGLAAEVKDGLEVLTEWQPNVVVVVGGMIWATPDAPDISQVLAAAKEQGAAVAGICGGTLALARSGLLDRVAHTSNDPAFLKDNAATYKGAALFKSSPSAVGSDGVITAPGTAPVSFTAAVFEAAGLPADAIAQFRQMMAAEHS